jgi:hypothetical protein
MRHFTNAALPSLTPDWVEWQQPITPSIFLGDNPYIRYLFRAGNGATSGTIDLGVVEANYWTCSTCIIVNAYGAILPVGDLFFWPSGGTMTLTEDPFTNAKLVATITDLSLTEATIDYVTGQVTFVPGGICLNLGTVMLAADAVPDEWTCSADSFYDHATCDCACGSYDPDCFIEEAPITGCPTGAVCGDLGSSVFEGECVTHATGDTCQTAVAITIGTPAEGSTTGATNNYDASLAACTGYSQTRGDLVYSVDLTAGQAIHVSLEGSGGTKAAPLDSAVAIVGPGAPEVCDASPSACLAGADLYPATHYSTVEEFDFTAPTAGTYYIIVDSKAAPLGFVKFILWVTNQ